MFDTLIHKYLRLPYTLHVYTVRKPKHSRATVLFLHGIGNSGAAWDDVVAGIPEDVTVIAVDLLGFGASPHPGWAVYSSATQARSVVATLIRLNIRRQLIVVGHSMGALVAVEMAKKYPLFVRSLILCSPPFYDEDEKRPFLLRRDKTLKRLYRLVQRHPAKVTSIAAFAVKYKLVEKTFSVTPENVGTYMAALEASIINQTALEDAKKLRKPMAIIHGALDPVVIKKNLDAVVAARKKASLTVVMTGHPILGRYVPALVKKIKQALPPQKSKTALH